MLPDTRWASKPSPSTSAQSAPLLGQQVPPVPWVTKFWRNSEGSIPGSGPLRFSPMYTRFCTLSNDTDSHHAL